jgi:hypothetical protein
MVGLLALLVGFWPTPVGAQGDSPVDNSHGTNPLDDPQGAVVFALHEAGISPSDADPHVTSTLWHADDLVYVTVRDHPEGLLAADLLRGYLEGSVEAAAHGEQVLGGWTREQLQAVVERAREANWATDPGGAALASRLQTDDALSLGIYAASLVGDLNSTVHDARYYSLPGACLDYHQAVATSPGSFHNCLEYLLR